MIAGTRILVADDDPELLQVLCSALSRAGAHVESARNGTELVQRLSQAAYNLIITDISMPAGNGLQALQAARTAGVATPVIVVTALSSSAIGDRVKKLGPSAFLLRKPFDLDELETLANALLRTDSRLDRVAR